MKKLFELINKNFEFSQFFPSYHAKGKKSLPIITISREKGSGGRPIAFLVAKKLGVPWAVFHKDIVEEIAKEVHLEKELIEEVDEAQIPLITQLIDNVLGKKYMNLSGYYKHLIHILSTIGHRGHAIIIGRGANFLFPMAFKVRIICEMEERIRGVMKYEKVNRREAEELIEKSDRERANFTQILFQHDPRKAHHYDMTIRTGKNLSLEDAASIIVDTARKKFGL